MYCEGHGSHCYKENDAYKQCNAKTMFTKLCKKCAKNEKTQYFPSTKAKSFFFTQHLSNHAQFL